MQKEWYLCRGCALPAYTQGEKVGHSKPPCLMYENLSAKAFAEMHVETDRIDEPEDIDQGDLLNEK